MNSLSSQLKAPLLASLMADRRIGWAVLGASAAQAGLMAMDLPGWPCPFRHGIGLPCPGCGLSRAVGALFQADWKMAFEYHAFAPLIVLALTILITASLMPNRQRAVIIQTVERIERRAGLSALLLLAMMAYWFVRLTVFHEVFIGLIMG